MATSKLMNLAQASLALAVGLRSGRPTTRWTPSGTASGLMSATEQYSSIRNQTMPLSLVLPGYTISSELESQDATIIIAWYTLVLHLVATFYFLDVYRGSDSDWIPSPLFEYQTDTMYVLALILAIYSFLYMIVASLGLLKGVKRETRIYYFPWLTLTAIEILLLFYQLFCITWRYSYDSDTNLIVVVSGIFGIYHIYLYLIVLSNYRYLKRIQNPTLIFPTEM